MLVKDALSRLYDIEDFNELTPPTVLEVEMVRALTKRHKWIVNPEDSLNGVKDKSY